MFSVLEKQKHIPGTKSNRTIPGFKLKSHERKCQARVPTEPPGRRLCVFVCVLLCVVVPSLFMNATLHRSNAGYCYFQVLRIIYCCHALRTCVTCGLFGVDCFAPNSSGMLSVILLFSRLVAITIQTRPAGRGGGPEFLLLGRLGAAVQQSSL